MTELHPDCLAETVNDECARVRCRLPRGHEGLHDDSNGWTWASSRE
ncbi:MAG: hypothetical protein M0R75_10800 [Dehalococcoidia bacterium]|nr:hypothetical protein [Dehalococcoidia bacterium]